MDPTLFEPCDLDELLRHPSPPAAKRAKKAGLPFAGMPGVKEEILADHEMMMRWRHDLHSNPELGFEEYRTSDMVAKLLTAWGIEVTKGELGGPTGVVGVLRGRMSSQQSIGLRADMDALPMQEESSETYKSTNAGGHHGCGHTTMLLGAAKYLAATRNFAGTVHFLFQPNEEATGEFQGRKVEHELGGSGGELMVRQGLFERFPIDQIYGFHNWPGLEAGTVGVKAGALMGSEDNFVVTVRGKGGHGAMPNLCVDPVLTGCYVVTALQSIVSRVNDPVDPLVVSVTQFNAGSAYTVTPQHATLRGTIRAFAPGTRLMAKERLRSIAEATADAHGCCAEVELFEAFPPTINDPLKAKGAADIAAAVVGAANVVEPEPTVASEDFSYMLRERPGCYMWLGNRSIRCKANLHECDYDCTAARTHARTRARARTHARTRTHARAHTPQSTTTSYPSGLRSSPDWWRRCSRWPRGASLTFVGARTLRTMRAF